MVEIDNIESTYLQHKIETLLNRFGKVIRADNKEFKSHKTRERIDELFSKSVFSDKKDQALDISFDTIQNKVQIENLEALNFDWNRLKDNEQRK